MKIHPAQELSTQARKTYMIDFCRAPFEGVVQSLARVFALLIGVKVFQASDMEKSIISIGPYAGSIFILVLLPQVSRWKIPKNIAGGILSLVFSFVLFILIFADSSLMYSSLISLCLAIGALRITFMTGIYHENYASKNRGKLFAQYVVLVTLFSLAAQHLISNYFDFSLDFYPYLIMIFLLFSFFSALLFFKYPSADVRKTDVIEIRDILLILKNDKLFLYILIVWFMFGIANLATFPLRTAFLAEEKYGYSYTSSEIAWYVGILPSLTFLIFTPIMSKVFDVFNFIYVRMFLNFCLGLSILLFFVFPSHLSFSLSAISQGIGLAGGNIAWNLWVTKIAPKESSTSYMAIHQLFTGIRGVVGPFVCFYSLAWFSVGDIGVFCSLLTFTTIFLLAFIHKKGNRFQH